MTLATDFLSPTHRPCRGRRRRVLRSLLAAGLGLILAACGGSDDDAPADAASASIGAAGGSVATPAGARVVIPAGALAAPTMVAIDRSNVGAPALPAGFAAAGAMFAFTPHGTTFAAPVTVSLPVDPAAVAAGRTPALYKTNAAGEWERVPGATVSGTTVTAQVTGFSWFAFGASPPTISQQPQSATVNAGATATFSVTALGAPPFFYRWERSIDAGANWTAVGATSRTYTTPVTTMADDGTRFRAVVANPDGETPSQPATLTVTTAVVAPAITTQPAAVSVVAGGSATFTVIASGTAPQHQWQISRDGGANFADIAGATNASYTHAAAPLADNGVLLRVVVSNSAGSVTTMPALLTVTAPGTGSGGTAGAVIAVGSDFSVAVLADGSVRSWGSDIGGAQGNGSASSADRLSPGLVAGLADVVAIDSGGGNTLALRRNGEVWGWGYNGFGSLGNGGRATAEAPTRFIGTPALRGVRAVAVSSTHSMVLRDDGRIETAGFNAIGTLGNPAVLHDTADAVEVVVSPGMRPVVAISAGLGFSVALDEDGVVWTWGGNEVGQLGLGTTTPANVPQRVVGIDPVRAIAAGHNHVLAVARDGRLWSWGSNLNGKLGQGEIGDFLALPGRVLLTGEITGIAAGAEHSVSLHFDGTVFTWGINETGQLATGSGSPGYRSTPGFVATLPSGIRAVAAGGGLGHSLALGADGRVWAWGRNDHGQVGDGTTVDRLSPVVVPGLDLD